MIPYVHLTKCLFYTIYTLQNAFPTLVPYKKSKPFFNHLKSLGPL
jgi:hypothetical protein